MNRLIAVAVIVLSACGAQTSTSDAGGSGGGSAGGSGGGSAGGSAGGSGGGSQPQPIAVTFGGCSALTPCGGDPIGTWHYSAACVNDPFGQASQVCAQATVENLSGTARGSLVFTAANVTRAYEVTVSGTVKLPASCLGGGAVTCAQVQTGLRNYYPGATCTSATGGGCDCAVTSTTNINDASAYTVTGNTLHVGSGDYDFCIGPTTRLQYRKTGSANVEDGLLTLTRQ